MEEGLINLANGGYRLTRADFTTLGWETSALILWVRDNLIFSLNSSPFRFTQDMIQCGNCSYNFDQDLSECYACDQLLGKNYLTVSVTSGFLASGTIDPGPLVKLDDICCSACDGRYYTRNIRCPGCSLPISKNNVRITLKKMLDEKIGEVFGEEIRDLSRL
jgi:hypothetical protein